MTFQGGSRVRRLDERPWRSMPEGVDPHLMLEMPFGKLMELLAGRLREIHDSLRTNRSTPGVNLDDLVLVEAVLLRLGDLVEEAHLRRATQGSVR